MILKVPFLSFRGRPPFDESRPGNTNATIQHVYEKIPGYCDDSLVEFYKKMVPALPTGSGVVEIGTLLGKSLSVLLVEMLRNNKHFKVWAVDTWDGAPGDLYQNFIDKYGPDLSTSFETLLSRYGLLEHVVPIKSLSWDAADQFEDASLEMVFIDANHDYGCISKDIDAWLPKLKPGGILSGHDYNPQAEWSREGVVRAVHEKFGESGFFVNGRCWWNQVYL